MHSPAYCSCNALTVRGNYGPCSICVRLTRNGNCECYLRAGLSAIGLDGCRCVGERPDGAQRRGRYRTWPSHSPSWLHSDSSRISPITTARGTERLTSSTPGMYLPLAVRPYAHAVRVLTSCVIKTRSSAAAQANKDGSSTPVRPTSCTLRTSRSGFRRYNPRTMSLFRFSSASQRMSGHD